VVRKELVMNIRQFWLCLLASHFSPHLRLLFEYFIMMAGVYAFLAWVFDLAIRALA
jgi:hypothetical protein